MDRSLERWVGEEGSLPGFLGRLPHRSPDGPPPISRPCHRRSSRVRRRLRRPPSAARMRNRRPPHRRAETPLLTPAEGRAHQSHRVRRRDAQTPDRIGVRLRRLSGARRRRVAAADDRAGATAGLDVPASSSSRYARATVLAARPSSAARVRTGGRRVPATREPSSIAAITCARTCSYGGVGDSASTENCMGQSFTPNRSSGWVRRHHGLGGSISAASRTSTVDASTGRSP